MKHAEQSYFYFQMIFIENLHEKVNYIFFPNQQVFCIFPAYRYILITHYSDSNVGYSDSNVGLLFCIPFPCTSLSQAGVSPLAR